MKAILLISAILLVVSCGKYERPFISFKSPEKRLTDNTWSCEKVVDEDGTEYQIEDRISFSSDGSFERITSHWHLNPLYFQPAPNPAIFDTIQGSWNWAPAVDGEVNKQLLVIKYDESNYSNTTESFLKYNRVHFVTVLSRKRLVFKDQTHDNTTYHYKKV